MPLDDEISRYLGTLEHADLVRRLRAIAERDEPLRLALTAEAEAAAGSIDLRRLKKELTVQLQVTDRSYDWRYARRYAVQADAALDVPASLLDGGHAAAVVELAEHCMKRLDTAGRSIDDSGGYLAGPIDRLKSLHHDACLLAERDPRELGTRLADWALSDESNWEWFLDAPTRYADVLGEDGLAAFSARIEPLWQALPPRPPARDRADGAWDPDRSKITYLREGLACAGGSVDELIDVLAHDLSSARQFARIADALEAAGREREALAWLERGNQVYSPPGEPELRSRIITAYLRDGQVEDAAALTGAAHESAPTVHTYEELRTVAEARGDWPARRAAALDVLRARGDRYGGRTAVVQAQLREDDLDGAWADADEGGVDDSTWLDLADASRGVRPDDAVRVYGWLVDRALEIADDLHYDRVVDLLGRWQATLRLHGRANEVDPRVAAIREQYARRTRLLKRMDRAGLA
jgi:tetratricopeptide (TPR) repeat protein